MTTRTQQTSGAQVARGASYLFTQGLVSNIAVLLFFIIAARILSTSDVGATSALGMISTLFITIGTFAIPAGATKYVSEYMGKDRQDVAKKIFERTLQFGFLAGITVALGLSASSAIVSQLVVGNSSLQPTIVVLAFDVFASLLNSFLCGILLGLQKFRLIASVGIAASGLKLLASLYFVFTGLGLFGVILGWAVADLVGSALWLFFTSGAFKEKKSSEEFSFAGVFRYALPLYGAGIVTYLSVTIDRFVLLSLSGLATLGIYSAAIAATNAIGIVSSSIASSLFPQFAQTYGRNGAHALKEASVKASRYVFLIFTPLPIGLAAISYPAIQLFFGESYISGWSSLATVSVAVALTSLSIIVGNLLLSLGMTRTTLEANIVGVTIGAVASTLLVSPLGSNGAALGRSSLIIASFAYSVYRLRKKFGLPLDNNTLKNCLFCSSIMAIAVASAQLLFYSKYMLPLYIAVGVTVYLFMLRFLKVINSNDVRLLGEILPERLRHLVTAFANFFS